MHTYAVLKGMMKIIKKFYSRDICNDIKIENLVLSAHCIVARGVLDTHMPPESCGKSLAAGKHLLV